MSLAETPTRVIPDVVVIEVRCQSPVEWVCVGIICRPQLWVTSCACVLDAQHTLSKPHSTHAGLPSPQVLQSFLTFQDAPSHTTSGPVTHQAWPPDPGPDQTALPSPAHPSVTQTFCGSTSNPAAASPTEPQETHRWASFSAEVISTWNFGLTVILLAFVSKGDDNGCNFSPGLLGSPPKQSKKSVVSPRKLGFDENSPVTACRQLVPLSPPQHNSSAPSSPGHRGTPFRSPAHTHSKGKSPDADLFDKGKASSFL